MLWFLPLAVIKNPLYVQQSNSSHWKVPVSKVHVQIFSLNLFMSFHIIGNVKIHDRPWVCFPISRVYTFGKTIVWISQGLFNPYNWQHTLELSMYWSSNVILSQAGIWFLHKWLPYNFLHRFNQEWRPCSICLCASP